MLYYVNKDRDGNVWIYDTDDATLELHDVSDIIKSEIEVLGITGTGFVNVEYMYSEFITKNKFGVFYKNEYWCEFVSLGNLRYRLESSANSYGMCVRCNERLYHDAGYFNGNLQIMLTQYGLVANDGERNILLDLGGMAGQSCDYNRYCKNMLLR